MNVPRTPSLLGRLNLSAMLGCLLTCTLALSACSGTSAKKDILTVAGHSIINNSGNKSMRFDLIRWGIKQFCAELTQAGTPLRLADDQPVIGRYFAKECSATILERDDSERVLARFKGEGFAWTALTGRIGFSAPALLELAPDFRVHKDALYVYFRPVVVDTSGLKLLMAEETSALLAADLVGVDEEKLGARIIQAQLKRGFTTIFHDDGHLDFSLGLVELGKKPFSPYTIISSSRRTVANGRTEIQAGGRDYIGKFELKAGESLRLWLHLEGTTSVDIALIPAAEASESLHSYVRSPGPAPSPKMLAYYSQAGKSAPLDLELQPPAGEYFLFIDHSTSFGDAEPMREALPARVDYLIQVGKMRSH